MQGEKNGIGVAWPSLSDPTAAEKVSLSETLCLIAYRLMVLWQALFASQLLYVMSMGGKAIQNCHNRI